MARYLFIVPPFQGHIYPTVSVARSLEEGGHQVAWAGDGKTLRSVVPAGSEMFGLPPMMTEQEYRDAEKRGLALQGMEALQFLYAEVLVPLCRSMLPPLEEAVEAYRPDVLVVDQQAFAGALVARRRGLPWATLVTTSATIVEPFAGFPFVQDWVEGLLMGLQKEAGLEPWSDMGIYSGLVVVFSTEALTGRPAAGFPAHVHFVGPSISKRTETVAFPWEDLVDMPRVLCTLGTVNPAIGRRFYEQVIEAFAGASLQVILVASPELVPEVPSNFIRRPFVPLLGLLPHVRGVICHAGQNTVVESLSHGVPLVVAPIRDDQPKIAKQVVDAGVGLRLRFVRVRAAEIREAVYRIMDEPSFVEAAERIRASFAAAGGARRAASLLGGLV